MREIILDTETTGLDPNSGHRIVEIGAIELMHHMRTGNNYHVYLNPERDMPQEAFNVHGISSEFLSDKPLFAQEVDRFMDFIGDAQMVIHNAGFDMKFINAELARCGFKPYPMSRAIDTVAMARKKFPGSPASLDALCKRFGIDLSGREKHGALLDAELLADVYIELLGGKQVTLALNNQEETTAQECTISIETLTSNTIIPPREFAISIEEQQAHARFIANIKDAIWLKYSEGQN